MSAPRVLVSGVVLGQPMGGVRRHNHELLPRARAAPRERGGGARGARRPRADRLRAPARDRAHPVRRARASRCSRARCREPRAAPALREARAARRPFDLVHTAHLPAPRGSRVPFTLTLHDLRSARARAHAAARAASSPRVIGGRCARAARVITVSETRRAPRSSSASGSTRRASASSRTPPTTSRRSRAGRARTRRSSTSGTSSRARTSSSSLRALAVDPALPDARARRRGEATARTERLRALARELGVADARALPRPVRRRASSPRSTRAPPASCSPRASRASASPRSRRSARASRSRSRASRPCVEVAGERVPRFAPGARPMRARDPRGARRERAELDATPSARRASPGTRRRAPGARRSRRPRQRPDASSAPPSIPGSPSGATAVRPLRKAALEGAAGERRRTARRPEPQRRAARTRVAARGRTTRSRRRSSEPAVRRMPRARRAASPCLGSAARTCARPTAAAAGCAGARAIGPAAVRIELDSRGRLRFDAGAGDRSPRRRRMGAWTLFAPAQPVARPRATRSTRLRARSAPRGRHRESRRRSRAPGRETRPDVAELELRPIVERGALDALPPTESPLRDCVPTTTQPARLRSTTRACLRLTEADRAARLVHARSRPSRSRRARARSSCPTSGPADARGARP